VWIEAILSAVDVEPGHHCGWTAIQGVGFLAGARVGGSGDVVEGGVEEGVEVDHVGGHVVCPFEDLGSDVSQEGVGGPAAENHDFGSGVVI